MIKVHVAADGTKSFQVYGRARIREKSVRVYVGSFASQKQAEAADEQHRVTQRAIKAGDLPAAVDHKRTLGDALDAWLRAIKDQRSHDEYESRMRLYVRPTFDSTPLVKITKPKLIDLRNSLKEREEPIGNATLNTLFASLSASYSYFIEQGWCSENPLKFIRDRVTRAPPAVGGPPATRVRRRCAAVPLRRPSQHRRHRHRHRARTHPARRPRPCHRTRHLRTGASPAPGRPPLGRRLVGAPPRSGGVCPHSPECGRPYARVIEPKGTPPPAETTAAKPRLNFLAVASQPPARSGLACDPGQVRQGRSRSVAYAVAAAAESVTSELVESVDTSPIAGIRAI